MAGSQEEELLSVGHGHREAYCPHSSLQACRPLPLLLLELSLSIHACRLLCQSVANSILQSPGQPVSCLSQLRKGKHISYGVSAKL